MHNACYGEITINSNIDMTHLKIRHPMGISPGADFYAEGAHDCANRVMGMDQLND